MCVFFYICANNSEFCAKSPSQMVCKIRVAYIANKSLLFWRKQFLGEFGGHIIFLFFILIKSSQLVQLFHLDLIIFYPPQFWLKSRMRCSVMARQWQENRNSIFFRIDSNGPQFQFKLPFFYLTSILPFEYFGFISDF